MTKDPLAADLKVILKWKDESEKKESDSGKENVNDNDTAIHENKDNESVKTVRWEDKSEQMESASGMEKKGSDKDSVNHENEQSNENGNNEAEKSREPEKKKAKIDVKEEIDKDGYKTKEYKVYAGMLANYSEFVKKALSMDMKEKQEMTIVFQDVTPQVFNVALKYVADPLAGYKMCVADAIAVLPFYDMYEFSAGLQLCDFVMHKYVKMEWNEMLRNSTAVLGEVWNNPPLDLGLLVTCFEMSSNPSYGLKNAKDAAVSFLRKNLKAHDTVEFNESAKMFTPITYGPTIFLIEHVQRLQTLLVEDVFPLIREEAGETNLKGILQLPKDVLCGNGFPYIFVSEMVRVYTKYLEPTDKVTVYAYKNGGAPKPDSTSESTGAYTRIPRPADGCSAWLEVYHQGEPPRFTIKKDDYGDWVIEKQIENAENVAYWKCPHTHNLPYPPIGTWKRVHGDSDGSEFLEIRYQH